MANIVTESALLEMSAPCQQGNCRSRIRNEARSQIVPNELDSFHRKLMSLSCARFRDEDVDTIATGSCPGIGDSIFGFPVSVANIFGSWHFLYLQQ